jgi:predicted esterase
VRQGSLRWGIALTLGSAAIAASPAAAAGRQPAPARLVVSSAQVDQGATRAKGSFVIANRGGKTSSSSTATISTSVAHQRRIMQSFSIAPIRPGRSRTVHVSFRLSALPDGDYRLRACAAVTSRSNGRCVTAGFLYLDRSSGTGTGTGTGTGPGSGTTVPSSPLPYQADTPFEVHSGGVDYWASIPAAYDSSNQTPMTLLVSLHGCYGDASGDIWMVMPNPARDYLAISVAGEADQNSHCWNPDTEQSKVLNAIANFKTHFNVNPRRVILSGYSSGGDLAYRTIFYHSTQFAGILAMNTSPFRDTGSTAAQSLAAASWKFHVVHLAHEQDAVYPLAGVTNEINQVRNAGFPVTFLTQPGEHYNDAGQNGYAGTIHDYQTYLLPHVDDGWLAPAG